jgi:hypothetical protein
MRHIIILEMRRGNLDHSVSRKVPRFLVRLRVMIAYDFAELAIMTAFGCT